MLDRNRQALGLSELSSPTSTSIVVLFLAWIIVIISFFVLAVQLFVSRARVQADDARRFRARAVRAVEQDLVPRREGARQRRRFRDQGAWCSPSSSASAPACSASSSPPPGADSQHQRRARHRARRRSHCWASASSAPASPPASSAGAPQLGAGAAVGASRRRRRPHRGRRHRVRSPLARVSPGERPWAACAAATSARGQVPVLPIAEGAAASGGSGLRRAPALGWPNMARAGASAAGDSVRSAARRVQDRRFGREREAKTPMCEGGGTRSAAKPRPAGRKQPAPGRHDARRGVDDRGPHR